MEYLNMQRRSGKRYLGTNKVNVRLESGQIFCVQDLLFTEKTSSRFANRLHVFLVVKTEIL